jgi:hypothetical protein
VYGALGPELLDEKRARATDGLFGFFVTPVPTFGAVYRKKRAYFFYFAVPPCGIRQTNTCGFIYTAPAGAKRQVFLHSVESIARRA